MKNLTSESFTLENFEGPLEFLYHLVQKNEIEVYDIPIIQIIEQYVSNNKSSIDLDQGAEFVSTTASLHCFKSKTLLPKHEQIDEQGDEKEDPRFEIIHQLLDYCRYKQAAKELAHREMRQNQYYFRGTEESEIKKNLGIHHLSLSDLAALFREVLERTKARVGVIAKEVWLVSDKISSILNFLKNSQEIEFENLFCPDMVKEELIVTFLAVLELMKMGKLKAALNQNHKVIFTA